MKKFTLIVIILSSFLQEPLHAENIEVSTLSPINASTFNPNTEKPTDPEKSNIFLNAVESYFSDSMNTKKDEPQTQVQGYIGQPMYPIYPPYSAGGYFYPGMNPNAVAPKNNEVQNNNYFWAVLPAAQMVFEIFRELFLYYLVRYFVLKLIKLFDLLLDIREVLIPHDVSTLLTKAALHAGLKLFAKLGLFLVGGAGLLILGGIFTTLVCYLTPICTITFVGYDFQKALDKETMRSLMTPEKIASAAALVQDAIGKYQRLQRAVGQ